MSELRIPRSTYRLQFSRQFRFNDAELLVPYLCRLGVSDLYASPILKARQGSSHGYDVVDPSSLNPELGTEADFEALARKLKEHDIGLLLDIVPNHMAASPENPWWIDIMENGLCSPYATFFDIDWSPIKNKVLIPILANPYEQTLGSKSIKLTLEDSGFFIKYDSYRLPLDVRSYGFILTHCLNTLKGAPSSNHPDFQQLNRLRNVLQRLPSVTSLNPKGASKQYRERQAVKDRFLGTINASARVKTFLLEGIKLLNGEKGEPNSIELMHSLLEQQAYRLAFWKTAREHVNYRRFFDINDLVGVRVEEPEVFQVIHARILQLIQQGKVTGLRIDHIDGLFDPLRYLFRLQQCITSKGEETVGSPSFYVVVEKILADDEILPPEWPVFGTTGYDFTAMVNGLFVDGKGIPTIDDSYSRFTGSALTVNDVIYEKKKQVIAELFLGEVRMLGSRLAYLASQASGNAALSPKELTKVLTEVTACLPIYRSYVRTSEVSSRDQLYLKRAIQEAQQRNPDMKAPAVNFLKQLFLLDFPADLNSGQKKAWLDLVLRWQQLTSAIMAKGFEDTALYNYNRLVSLNDVGGDPNSSGLSIDDFHRRNLERHERWPHTLNATSTHDTKRSEDVRARINVLSEIPGEWNMHMTQWSEWNQEKKQIVNGIPVPEPNIEILLYQTLIGAWPLEDEGVPEFKQRLKAYMVKAVREAKVFTDWLSPDPDYESALATFLESILDEVKYNNFLKDFLSFKNKIAYYGALNSLSQVLLKVTSPGVPDFYQGTELWDFSLVDPDNRRPVDYKKRTKILDDIIQQETRGQQTLVQQALTSWVDGHIKLYVTYKALKVRSSYRDICQDGQYVPIQMMGQRQENVLAFGRQKSGVWMLVVVPVLLTKLVNVGNIPIGREVWGDDTLLLPEGTPRYYLNIFTGEKLGVSSMEKSLSLSKILGVFPLALLIGSNG